VLHLQPVAGVRDGVILCTTTVQQTESDPRVVAETVQQKVASVELNRSVRMLLLCKLLCLLWAEELCPSITIE